MQNKSRKLQISAEVKQVWQDFLDVIAEMVGVPVALIMQIEEPCISVFLSSATDGNPYNPGDKELLKDSGLYCEHVIKTKRKLLVANALNDKDWDHNPDIKLGMISYLGFPIIKPDGEPFGTLCILDNKENTYNPITHRLMEHYRNMIQRELELEYMNMLLGHQNTNLNDYIEDLKQKTETIMQKSQQLHTLNLDLSSKLELMNWLITVITHDLRGPLWSLREYLNIFQAQQSLTGEYQEALQETEERLNQMYKIVNEMLESIRGQNTLLADMNNMKVQNIVPLLRSIYDLYGPIAKQKGLDLSFVYNREVIEANVEQNLLKIAVRNLLNNAVKHCMVHGKILLEVKALDQGLEIRVDNEGKGISQEDLDLLRNGLYSESNDPQTEALKGFGVGLELCRECLARMDGELEIDSIQGHGASFIIRIPKET